MPFVKGQKPPKKGQKIVIAPSGDLDLVRDAVREVKAVGLESTVTMPEATTVSPGLDDYYEMLVDYITSPTGNPLASESGRVSRSALYESGINIDAQLKMGSIRYIGKMEK